MSILDLPRSSPARAGIIAVLAAHVVLLPPALPTAWARASASMTPSFDDLMVHAEARRAAGDYAESASFYGQAYRARPEAERADEVGEITVRNAMEDYDLAARSEPDLASLEAQAQLLDEFLTARRRARDAAQVAKAKDVPEVPQDLVDELERLEARIAGLREAEAEAEAAAERAAMPASDPEPAPLLAREPTAVDEPEATANAKRDGAILGVGVVSLVGGVALIAGGGWTFVQIRERGEARLDALDAESRYSDEQRRMYREALVDWQQQQRRGPATALVVSGAVLAAAGIGLTSWGIVRMRRHRSASDPRASLAPNISRENLGLQLVMDF